MCEVKVVEFRTIQLEVAIAMSWPVGTSMSDPRSYSTRDCVVGGWGSTLSRPLLLAEAYPTSDFYDA